MDIWVQNSQFWLNSTYGSHPGYVLAPTDGMTGWDTIYSMTRALQIELGIAAPSDNFGPLTLNELSDHGNVKSTESNHNIVGILQCALWCKGYFGGAYIGTWQSSLTSAVSQVRVAMGLGSGSSVTPKMFKSLLTMDAYVVIGAGTSSVRTIQQWLNGRYKDRSDFYLVPCDGLFSRDVQYGLMLAIQYEIGMADGVANGNLGPGTKSGLIAQGNISYGSVDGAKKFVRLFQAALTFNGYIVPFDGSFGVSTRLATENFQGFVALPITKVGDFATWASLLVSTGDVDRAGTACDCITTITSARAATLLAAGYRIAGRYLTNYPGPGALDKCIKPGELSTIFSNGMSVFPIFQVGGDSIDYFSYGQGYRAAKAADAAALSYGFKPGTIIYFAVDFDALEEEVWDVVVPHFEGINGGLVDVGSSFAVGIYGARNTCAIVSGEGLATSSFVGGMSTGYSGNLGYPLPQNWAFDQILEYSIGTGAGAIAIDKDIASGRDPGQTSIQTPSTLPDFVNWLAGMAAQFMAQPSWTGFQNVDDLVLQYLRQPEYDDATWTAVVGPVNQDFVAYVELQSRARVWGLVSPGSNLYINADHVAASLQGRRMVGSPHSLTLADKGDMSGWAGDVAQLIGRFAHDRRSTPSLDAYQYAATNIARLNGDSAFSASDFDEDIDAHLIAQMMGGATDFEAALHSYYNPSTGGALSRYSQFLAQRFGGLVSNAYSAAIDGLVSTVPDVLAMREGIWLKEVGVLTPLGANEITGVDIDAVAQAFVEALQQKIADE